MISDETDIPYGINVVILLVHKLLAILGSGKQIIILNLTIFLNS